METSIIISGFGGQGALFAGQLLAYAGMDVGKHVTWIPSYGPEMRGGTAHCTVIISDDPIGTPIVAEPQVVIALNQPSYEKYEPIVQPGGTFVVNSSLVNDRSSRKDVDVVYVPASTIAEAHGSIKMLNMAAIGALLARHLFLPITAVEDALENHLPKSKKHLLEANFQVLHGGLRAATVLNNESVYA